jgi:voltage-gated potassium channel
VAAARRVALMRGRARGIVDRLTDHPDHALVGVLRIPESQQSPVASIGRRLVGAALALIVTVLLVYLGRHGYRDVNEDGLSLLDCIYYATVSLSTTGYGDITPVSESARLVNVLVITPLRVLFLIVLVGTTLEVLRVRDHVVVIGYGTKGRSAVSSMLGDDEKPVAVVVVDTNPSALEAANASGLVTVNGNGTRSDVLRLAGVARARAVVIATNRDDAAVLVALTARELAPTAHIVAAVRERENVHLLRQSGANSVVVSSETAGRLLGMATRAPAVVELVEDLLTPEAGLAIAQRPVEPNEVGASPRHLPDIVLGVVRSGRLYRVDAPEVDAVKEGDIVLYVRKVPPT